MRMWNTRADRPSPYFPRRAVARLVVVAWACVIPAIFSPVPAAAEAGTPLKQGDPVSLNGRRYVLTKLDAPPYVESEYTRRFTFDAYDNPKLKELRERYQLDEVVAPGKDEFDRQVLLLDWVNHRLKKFGRPTSKARGRWTCSRRPTRGTRSSARTTATCWCRRRPAWAGSTARLALRRPDHLGQRLDRAHLDGDLVEPVPQVGAVRPDLRDVRREGRRAAERLRVPAGVVLPRRQGRGVRPGQGPQALPQVRHARLPRPLRRLRRPRARPPARPTFTRSSGTSPTPT